MTGFAAGCALLITSLVSLAVYVVSLLRLLAAPHNRGLVRTTACRVAAAFLYTVISMSTIVGKPSSAFITVGAFIVIQLTWQANSVADVFLARRKPRKGHRR